MHFFLTMENDLELSMCGRDGEVTLSEVSVNRGSTVYDTMKRDLRKAE